MVTVYLCLSPRKTEKRTAEAASPAGGLAGEKLNKWLLNKGKNKQQRICTKKQAQHTTEDVPTVKINTWEGEGVRQPVLGLNPQITVVAKREAARK